MLASGKSSLAKHAKYNFGALTNGGKLIVTSISAAAGNFKLFKADSYSGSPTQSCLGGRRLF
jgi:hypothetical protein